MDILTDEEIEAALDRGNKLPPWGIGSSKKDVIAAIRRAESAILTKLRSAQPVATVVRGGLDRIGKATAFRRWEVGAEHLPDGEHKLYLHPAPSEGDRRDARVAELEVALRDVLDTHEKEAETTLSLEVAQDNYSDCSREVIAHERAMLDAGNAEQRARQILNRS